MGSLSSSTDTLRNFEHLITWGAVEQRLAVEGTHSTGSKEARRGQNNQSIEHLRPGARKPKAAWARRWATPGSCLWAAGIGFMSVSWPERIS